METVGVIASVLFFLVFALSFFAPVVIIILIISKFSNKSFTMGVTKNGIKFGSTQTSDDTESDEVECVNDFDNTCEHAHLTDDVVDNRYDVDEVVKDDGPIATDTYKSPIRKE